MSQRKLLVPEEIPGIEFHAQLRRDYPHPSTLRIGEFDALEHRAGAVDPPGEMHIVETHREPGAVGDEFFEGGALFGNSRGDDPREHRSDDGEQTQADADQHRPSHPM